MSTPSTVTAVHPHHPFYSHYPDYQLSSSSQRQSNLPLPRSTKLAHHHNNYTAAASPADRQLPPLPSHRPPTTNGVKSEPSVLSNMSNSRNKQKKADWNEFYRNGLPKEVIVIDDSSPEPAENHTALHRTTSQHENKRRRTDAAYDSMQNGQLKSVKPPTSAYDEGNTSSTASSARNTSALYSTAPTSLTSVSSGGHQLQKTDESKPGQKRKRGSRQAPEEESPELEITGQNQAWTNYVPPPKPPVKAGEVYTPVVRDVSSCLLTTHTFVKLTRSKKTASSHHKIDDDDGHYIVTPDTDLTERCMY